MLEKHGSRVRCVGEGCEETYSDHAVARLVPPGVFKAYFNAKNKISETRIAAELEKDVDRRVKEEAEPTAEQSRAKWRSFCILVLRFLFFISYECVD